MSNFVKFVLEDRFNVTQQICDCPRLTKEKAIKLHRKMWSDIDEFESERINYDLDRYDLKKLWLISNHIDPASVLNHCFCCQYAKQFGSGLVYDGSLCKYCPINWGGNREEYMCEDDNNGINWVELPAGIIANLPESE